MPAHRNRQRGWIPVDWSAKWPHGNHGSPLEELSPNDLPRLDPLKAAFDFVGAPFGCLSDGTFDVVLWPSSLTRKENAGMLADAEKVLCSGVKDVSTLTARCLIRAYL